MEPLKTVHWLLTWQYMSQSAESGNVKKRTAYVAVASVIFILSFYYMTSSFIIFMRFSKIDMKMALFAFLTFCANCTLLYTLINAFSFRFKINDLFQKFSIIYTESKEYS